MVLRVPTSKVESVGMRKISESDLVEKALKIHSTSPVVKDGVVNPNLGWSNYSFQYSLCMPHNLWYYINCIIDQKFLLWHQLIGLAITDGNTKEHVVCCLFNFYVDVLVCSISDSINDTKMDIR